MRRFRYSEKHGDLIGAHLSTKGGLHTVFERAAEVNATAVALFAKNSNQWKGKELTDDDCKLFAKKRFVKPVFTHTSYLINLATTNEGFHKKSIAAMLDELDRAERLGIRAVVLHPPAVVAMLPFHRARPPVDEADRVEAAEADQDIAVGQRRNRVGMGELVAPLARTDRILFDLHVPAGMPFPDRLAVEGYLADEVRIHASIWMRRIRQAAGHARLDVGRDPFPGEEDRISVGQAAEVMMLADVPMLPHHFAAPVVLP